MAKVISSVWKEKIKSAINNHYGIDEVISYLPATQWLITQLAFDNRPYKIYKLGAGVVRVTTDTDTCPCCKGKLK